MRHSAASSGRWRDTAFCGASGWCADAASGGGRACFQGRPERAAPDRALYGARRMKGGARKQAHRAASMCVPLFSDALRKIHGRLGAQAPECDIMHSHSLGGLAQLVRAGPLHGQGRGFESLILHHLNRRVGSGRPMLAACCLTGCFQGFRRYTRLVRRTPGATICLMGCDLASDVSDLPAVQKIPTVPDGA